MMKTRSKNNLFPDGSNDDDGNDQVTSTTAMQGTSSVRVTDSTESQTCMELYKQSSRTVGLQTVLKYLPVLTRMELSLSSSIKERNIVIVIPVLPFRTSLPQQQAAGKKTKINFIICLMLCNNI
jgi:hypothetical protein